MTEVECYVITPITPTDETEQLHHCEPERRQESHVHPHLRHFVREFTVHQVNQSDQHNLYCNSINASNKVYLISLIFFSNSYLYMCEYMVNAWSINI